MASVSSGSSSIPSFVLVEKPKEAQSYPHVVTWDTVLKRDKESPPKERAIHVQAVLTHYLGLNPAESFQSIERKLRKAKCATYLVACTHAMRSKTVSLQMDGNSCTFHIWVTDKNTKQKMVPNAQINYDNLNKAKDFIVTWDVVLEMDRACAYDAFGSALGFYLETYPDETYETVERKLRENGCNMYLVANPEIHPHTQPYRRDGQPCQYCLWTIMKKPQEALEEKYGIIKKYSGKSDTAEMDAINYVNLRDTGILRSKKGMLMKLLASNKFKLLKLGEELFVAKCKTFPPLIIARLETLSQLISKSKIELDDLHTLHKMLSKTHKWLVGLIQHIVSIKSEALLSLFGQSQQALLLVSIWKVQLQKIAKDNAADYKKALKQLNDRIQLDGKILGDALKDPSYSHRCQLYQGYRLMLVKLEVIEKGNVSADSKIDELDEQLGQFNLNAAAASSSS